MSNEHSMALQPTEAINLAINAYTTLKGWSNYDAKGGKDVSKPIAALESREVISNALFGSGSNNIRGIGKSAQLNAAFTAETHSTQSGFGFILEYQKGGSKHVVVATRGTRPELAGNPDLWTDLNIARESFNDVGLVHSGFRTTTNSILSRLKNSSTDKLIDEAENVHFVGHSLGGAVATLLAVHYKTKKKKGVRLYTFGSPRVGANGAHLAIESCLGIGNIYSVTHELDPITMIAPYPYVQLNRDVSYANYFSLPCSGSMLPNMSYHDTFEYKNTVINKSWKDLSERAKSGKSLYKTLGQMVGPDNIDIVNGSMLSLGLIWAVIKYAVQAVNVMVKSVHATVIDLICEALIRLKDLVVTVGGYIVRLLECLAKWAGVAYTNASLLLQSTLRIIASRMLSVIGIEAQLAIERCGKNISPVSINNILENGGNIGKVTEI